MRVQIVAHNEQNVETSVVLGRITGSDESQYETDEKERTPIALVFHLFFYSSIRESLPGQTI